MKPRRLLFPASLIVSLLTSASSFATTYQWDVNDSATGLGGTGIWDTSGAYWDLVLSGLDDGTDITQPVNPFTNLDKAIFGGTAGTVTLGTGVTINAVQFDVANYILTGGTLTFAGTSPTITANQNATIASILDGTAGLTKTGTGALILSGANTFKGTTTVSAGTLQLNNTLGGGTYANNMVLTGGKLVADNAITQTLSGAISGDSTTVITAKNGSTLTFAGGRITGGAARTFTGGNTSGSATGGTVTFGNNEVVTQDQYAAITGGLTVNIQNGASINAGTYNYHVGYTGSSVSYTGVDTVNMTGGSLTNVGTLTIGSYESGIFNQSGGALSVSSLNIRQYSNAGSGTYNLSGGSFTGAINLGAVASGTATSTWNFTGGTALVSGVTVSNGTPTWNFGGGTLKASAAFTIANTIPINLSGTNGNATVDTNNFAVGISGLISGVGGLTKTGTATLTLNGAAANTFEGGLAVNRGTVELDYANLTVPTDLLKNTNVLTLGGGTVSVKGKTGANITSQAFASTTLNAGASGANLTLNTGTSNTLDLKAITRSAGSTLNITAATALTNSASATEIVKTSGLTYNGAAVTLPSSGNKYVGAGVFANSGTATRYAQVTSTGQFIQGPTATGWISTGGDAATVYNASTAGTAAAGATLTGATTMYGTIFNWGAATTQALGANNLTTNGILNIGTATTTISGTGSVVIGAEKDLVVNTANTGGITISSVIANNGSNASSLTFTGQSTGVLTLNTSNKTYTGGTYVNSGTLSLDGGGGSDGLIRGTATVAAGATLRLNAGDVTGYGGTATALTTINLNGGTLNVNTATANQTLGNCVINMTGGAITGATGSKMDFFAGSSAINSLASSVSSTIATTALWIRQSGGLTLTVADGAAATDLQIDSVINNNSSFTNAPLIKSGAGLLLLNGVNTYTGATTINAGTFKVGGSGSLGSGTYAANITNNGTLFQYSSSANQTLSGNISGSGGLTKDTGTGTLTLSGTNTYSGPTLVSAGRLKLSGTNASPITVGPGATLASSGSTTGDLKTLGTATIALNGTSPSSAFSTSGAVTIGGTTNVVFDVVPTAIGSTSHTVLAYGTSINGVSNLVVPSGYRNAAFTDDTVNKKVLFGITTGNRTWNNDGVTAGNWNNLTDVTWLGDDSMFANGDAVTFDDEATNGAVTLVGTLLPSAVTFNNSLGGTTYILSGSGSIGGTTSLVKNGTGTVTLQTVNSYTGGTTVNGGVLVLNSTAATWNVGIIRGVATVNNGGTLRISNGNNTAPTDTINVNGGGILDYSLAYLPDGSGTTYIGTVNLSSANGTAATVSGVGAPRMGFNANGLISSTGSVANTWSANLQLVNGSGYKVTFDTAASNTLNFTGNITQMTGYLGTPLIKNSAGTLVLSGNNSFSGGFTINDGVVRLASSTAFPSANALTMTGAGTLELNNNNVSLASLTSASTNTITNNATTAGTATLTVNGAGTLANKFTNGTTGTLALRVTNATGNFSLTNGSNTFSGGIVLTAGGTRMSTGTTITAGAYGTGAITVGEAATDSAQIYPGGAQTLANDIISNTNLGTDRPGTFRVDVASFVLSGTLTANLAPMTFSTNGTGTMSTTGKITGSNGLMLLSNNTLGAANGSLVVTLNNAAGTNDYAGDTTINQSAANGVDYTLVLGAANQIPNGTGKGNVVINTSGTAIGSFSLGGFSETINGLSGNGTVDGASGTPTLTLGDGNATASFSGDIKNTAGTLSLAKIGTGIQTLSGASTYGGNTTVNAGTLLANNTTGSATGTGTVTVKTTATLGGTGSVAGAVSVESGGTLSPGVGGVETLDAGDNVTLASGSNYAVDVTGATTCDKVVLASGKTLTANGTITLIPTGHTFAAGNSYDIADATTITGTPTISPATPGAGLQWNTTAFATTGVISVEAVGGYDSWSSQITNGKTGRLQDADDDGFTNLQEFLFGTDPMANTGSLTTVERSGGDLIIRWKQRTSGAAYQLKESATLGNDWVNATGATIVDEGAVSGDYQGKKATITLGSGKDFFRVEGVEN